jgi:hypothetical protein
MMTTMAGEMNLETAVYESLRWGVVAGAIMQVVACSGSSATDDDADASTTVDLTTTGAVDDGSTSSSTISSTSTSTSTLGSSSDDTVGEEDDLGGRFAEAVCAALEKCGCVGFDGRNDWCRHDLRIAYEHDEVVAASMGLAPNSHCVATLEAWLADADACEAVPSQYACSGSVQPPGCALFVGELEPGEACTPHHEFDPETGAVWETPSRMWIDLHADPCAPGKRCTYGACRDTCDFPEPGMPGESCAEWDDWGLSHLQRPCTEDHFCYTGRPDPTGLCEPIPDPLPGPGEPCIWGAGCAEGATCNHSMDGTMCVEIQGLPDGAECRTSSECRAFCIDDLCVSHPAPLCHIMRPNSIPGIP